MDTKEFEKREDELKETAKIGNREPRLDFGVEETAEVVVSMIKFANATKKSLDDDGKITASDAFNYIGAVSSLPKAISGAKFVPSEIKDMDEKEAEVLVGLVKNKLNWASDEKVKEAIDKVFVALKAIVAIIRIL